MPICLPTAHDPELCINTKSCKLRRMNASVLLVKALGGGWQKGESTQADEHGKGRHTLPAEAR